MDQELIRETLVASYAAGALDPGLALMVETQSAMSPRTEHVRARAEAAAGALFERETPAPLSAQARVRALALIDAPSEAATAAPIAPEVADLPAPVRDAASAALAKGARWRFATPGLDILRLPNSGACKVELLRARPGASAPTHTHEGGEYTLVLTGAFADETGRYEVGDIQVADASLQHRPVAQPGPVCYLLAVSEGRLRFSGALGALQKLIDP